MVQVPGHGITDPLLETDRGLPAEFLANFASIDGIASVVAGAIIDETDQGSARLAIGQGIAQLVKDIADGLHHLNIQLFAIAANVVGFTQPTFLQDSENSCTMIPNEKPVADVFSVTVDRQFFPLQGVIDDERNELFGKLIGTIVIGTVGDQHRQPIGMSVGTDQMIRGRFAG